MVRLTCLEMRTRTRILGAVAGAHVGNAVSLKKKKNVTKQVYGLPFSFIISSSRVQQETQRYVVIAITSQYTPHVLALRLRKVR